MQVLCCSLMEQGMVPRFPVFNLLVPINKTLPNHITWCIKHHSPSSPSSKTKFWSWVSPDCSQSPLLSSYSPAPYNGSRPSAITEAASDQGAGQRIADEVSTVTVAGVGVTAKSSSLGSNQNMDETWNSKRIKTITVMAGREQSSERIIATEQWLIKKLSLMFFF